MTHSVCGIINIQAANRTWRKVDVTPSSPNSFPESLFCLSVVFDLRTSQIDVKLSSPIEISKMKMHNEVWFQSKYKLERLICVNVVFDLRTSQIDVMPSSPNKRFERSICVSVVFGLKTSQIMLTSYFPSKYPPKSCFHSNLHVFHQNIHQNRIFHSKLHIFLQNIHWNRVFRSNLHVFLQNIHWNHVFVQIFMLSQKDAFTVPGQTI